MGCRCLRTRRDHRNQSRTCAVGALCCAGRAIRRATLDELKPVSGVFDLRLSFTKIDLQSYYSILLQYSCLQMWLLLCEYDSYVMLSSYNICPLCIHKGTTKRALKSMRRKWCSSGSKYRR